MVHFDEFLKTWSLCSNSVTRQVSFNRTKIGGKCQNWNIQTRHFGWFSNTVYLVLIDYLNVNCIVIFRFTHCLNNFTALALTKLDILSDLVSTIPLLMLCSHTNIFCSGWDKDRCELLERGFEANDPLPQLWARLWECERWLCHAARLEMRHYPMQTFRRVAIQGSGLRHHDRVDCQCPYLVDWRWAVSRSDDWARAPLLSFLSWTIKTVHCHGVWKSQKNSHITLHTFTWTKVD